MSGCEFQSHGVSRTELGDGTVRLDLTGWRYTSNAERAAGAGPVVRGTEPCATVTVPVQYSTWDGEQVQVMEVRPAAEMVTEHYGDPYTIVWQGRGWTVEVSSTYPLWQVTS